MKRIYKTPLGTFNSINEASEAHELSPELIRYYCRQSELQRNGKFLYNKASNKPKRNYTEWIEDKVKITYANN